ncbi:hypothetical protein BFP72_08575 [Reichenbachiella sp. 5M10]|nr:hypothetical protein BFP72_08575 [Reichenbachiella sp. 5M10]
MSKEQLLAIERQLHCPTGDEGVEMALNMNVTNEGMIASAIEALGVVDDEVILELGHGNGAHLSMLLSQGQGVRYHGLEISPTMQIEAQRIHQGEQRAEFHLYDGNTIPFDSQTFDKVISVNTLYFWNEPVQLLSNISRVMKPGGLLVLAFAQKEFMKTLPFVKSKFRLYDHQDFRALVHTSDLRLQALVDHTEEVKSKGGERVVRPFSVAIMVKENE